jgi:hypothetical protein
MKNYTNGKVLAGKKVAVLVETEYIYDEIQFYRQHMADLGGWIYCELDQVSGGLALNDPAYLRYIVRTYDYWFKYMVDHEHREIWAMVSAATNQQAEGYPKQHSWKNALHSFEHVLLGYIFAQQLHGETATLYYAWQDTSQKRRIAPYFYQGTVTEISETTVGNPSEKRQKVSFTTIH